MSSNSCYWGGCSAWCSWCVLLLLPAASADPALGAQARAVSVPRLSAAVRRMLLPCLNPKEREPLEPHLAISSIAGRNTNAHTHIQ